MKKIWRKLVRFLTNGESVAQQALRMLQDIPEDKWIAYYFAKKEQQQCCVIGHYTRLNGLNPNDYSPGNCNDWYRFDEGVGCPLRMTSRKFFGELGEVCDISAINNSDHGKYQQLTPKQRSIACLKDMVEAGY